MSIVCKLARLDSRAYTNQKNAIINNRLVITQNGKLIILKDETLVKYFTDVNTRFGQGHYKLSNAQRLEVINQIEQELKNEGSLNEDTQFRINQIRQQLGSPVGGSVSSIAVTTEDAVKPLTDRSKVNLPKNTPIARVDRNSALLFPVLSNSLNQHALNYIFSAFKNLCIWDENKNIIVKDNETLTSALLNFKREQYEILKRFTGEADTEASISEVMTESEVETYNRVLAKAWDKIAARVNEQEGQIDAAVTSGVWQNILNPVIAFYTLQDFDTLIKHILSDYITIDPKQMGTLTNSDEKYKLKEKKKVNSDFEDSFKSSDGENLADNLLTTFITSTVVPETGMPLAKDFKTTFLIEVKNAIENIDIDTFNAKESKNNENAPLQKLRDSLLNDNLPAVEKVNNLVQVLLTKNDLTKKIGFDRCRALGNRLNKFLQAYNESLKDTSSKARASMDKNYNVGTRLIDSFNQGVTGFISIENDGSVSAMTAFSKKKSKQYVANHIKNAIRGNLQTATMSYYSDRLYLGTASAANITDIYSDNVKEYLTRVTGLNFYDANILNRFNSPQNLQILRDFLQVLNFYISQESDLANVTMLSSTEDAINRVITRLSRNGAYIAFSNIIVQENDYQTERMFGLDGNSELPKTTITTLTSQFNRCKKRLSDLLGNDQGIVNSKNIILAKPDLTKQSKVSFDNNNSVADDSGFQQHIMSMYEIRLANGEVKRWVDLSVNELLEEQLGGLYLRNIIENGTAGFQIEAASDKVKVPIGCYNMKSVTGSKILGASWQEILLRAQRQAQVYYGALEKDLLRSWNIIAKELDPNIKDFADLHEIKTWLDGSKIPVARLNPIALKYNENIKFQKEILYSVNGGFLTLNNCLLEEIENSKNLEHYQQANEIGFQSYISHLSGNGNPKCNIQFFLQKYADGKNEHANNVLMQLFGYTEYNQLRENVYVPVNKGAFDITAKDENGNLVYNDFLRKYHSMYRLFHEADTELYQKHYWCHGGNDADTGIEQTKRIQKSEKRNNSLSATMSPLTPGLKYGVGAKVRIAQVESLRTSMTTMFGDRDELKAHDGAIWSTMVLRVLEQNSSLQVDMAKTAKTITLCPDGFGITQLKCADYTMDNAFIRNSIPANNYSNQTMGAKVAMYKMLGVAKLGDVFYDNFADAAPDGNVDLGLSQVIYDFGGRQAYLKNYYVYDNGELQAEWVYLDNGEAVDTNTVGTALGLQVNEDGEALIVSNLYDLWKFFGAEYSMGYNEEGEVVFNDASQEYVAYLMSEFDPSLKEVMIGKLVDPESSKSTQTLTNSRTDAFTEAGADLVTTMIESQQYGPQQDHTHETEESTIPALTQVITAIAFNGQNPELVQQMYELLGKLTTIELEDLNFKAKSTNKTAFYRKIGQMIYNNLKDNNIISNAQMILTNTLQELTRNSDLFAPRALPLSDNNLFHKATAQMLSKLNKAIRQRFSGVSVIQNPAQGIIGIYEDAEGVTYLKTDLIEAAKEWAGKNVTYVNNDDLIQQYLTEEPRFRDTKLTDANMHKLTIGYFVRKGLTDSLGNAIIDPVTGEQQKSDLIEVDTPEKLWQIYDEIRDPKRPATYYLVHNTQRNLATTQISWTEGAQHKNIWMLESTKQLITQRIAYKGKWPKSTFVSDWHDANIDGLRNGDAIGTYYYATENDYRSGNKTYVTNIVYRGGEEILPKIFREKMGLRHSLSKIKRQKENYFKDLIESRWKLDASLEGKIIGQDWALSGDNYDIVFRVNQTVTNNGYIERFDDQKKARILDADGTEIVKMYLPEDSEATVNINHIAGGKKIITIGINIDQSTKQADYQRIIDSVKYNQLHHAESGYDGVLDKIAVKRQDLTPAEIEDRAKKMYASFELMLKTISARIPSQSFQSFLSNETVGFTEDNSNNGYMNLYEMMFQGSDYDIDHAYTMIFDVSDSGIIEGNVFSDYSSPESLMESLLLPQPNKNLVISEDPKAVTLSAEAFDNLFANYQKGNYASIKFILNELQKRFDATKQPLVYNGDNVATIAAIKDFNSYNYSELSEQTIKNSVMAGIRKASSDLANLKASQVPMISKPVNDAINKSVANFGTSNGVTYLDSDPTHIADFQFQGFIGKKGVGIAANSIKGTGAIQQITNMKHIITRSKVAPGQLPIDMNVALRFKFHKDFYNEKGEKIRTEIRDINERLFRVPNTPITKAEFQNQFDTIFPNGEAEHPLYNTYENLVSNSKITIVTEKQQSFIDAYNAVKEKNGLTSTPAFMDVMYEMIKNEQNVADMESIFISLCTDNAKELQLYRIAGVPELLNMPLTMIALGMEIQDVTDICVNYLIPLLNQMSQSRLANKNVVTNVGSLIENFVKDTSLSADDRMSWNSLQIVYKAAQELRYISGHFKINQGTSVRYAETFNFLASFDRMMEGILVDGEKVTKEKIFERDADYRQQVVEEYEKHKAAFNVAEVVFLSPHFFAQLQACYDVFKKANENIAVSYLSSRIAEKMLDAEKIKYNNAEATQKVIQVVQNYALTYALKQLPNVTFDKWSTLERYGNWDVNVRNDIEIGVSNYRKADQFINFVEKGLIPYLKRNYADNFFVKILTVDTRNGHFQLPISNDTKGDFRAKMDINQASLAFSELCSLPSGLKTLDNVTLTIGDLMYLYTVMINQNRMNTTSTVIFSTLGKGSQIHPEQIIDNTYAELDRLTGIASVDPEVLKGNTEALQIQKDAVSKLAAIEEAAQPYVEARLNGGTAVVNDLNYDITDTSVPLYTMLEPRIKSDLGVPVENAVTSLNKMAKISATGSTIENAQYNETNKSMLIRFRTPGVLGQGNQSRAIDVQGIETVDGRLTYQSLDILAKAVSEYTQSLLYSVNQAINEDGTFVENETLKGLLGNKKASVSKDLSGIEGFTEWLEKTPQTVSYLHKGSYMKSHVEKIGSQKVLVLNEMQLQQLSSEDLSFELLNLYLDSKSDKINSEQDRLVQLLQLVGIKVDKSTLTEVLAQESTKTTIKKIPFIEKWVRKTRESSVTSDVKAQAKVTYALYGEALKYRDLYYRPAEALHLPKVGDIYQYISKTYIYLGDSNNQMILQNLEDPTDIVVESKMTTNAAWKCIQTLKPTMTYNALDLNLYKNEKYLEKTQKLPITDVNIGDMITIGNQSFVVYNMVYVKNGDNYEAQYIVYNDKTEDFEIKTVRDVTNGGNYVNVKKRDVITVSYAQESKEANVELGQASTSVKIDVASKMMYGTKFTIVGGNDQLTFSRYANGFIETTSHTVYPVEQLDKVFDFNIVSLTPNRLFDVDSLEYTYNIQEGDTKIQEHLIRAIQNLPEFQHSIETAKTLVNFTLAGSKESQSIKVRPYFVVNGVQFELFRVPNDMEIFGRIDKNTSIEQGDLIETQPVSANSDYTMRQVLDVLDNGQLLVLESSQKIVESLDAKGNKVTSKAFHKSIKTISTESVKGSILRKKNENLRRNRITAQNVKFIENPTDQCEMLLSFLAEKFNTRVELVDDASSNWNARVNDGVVQINISKSTDKSSTGISQFIIQQGVHEFTHLVLADMLANDTTNYMRLFNAVKTVLNKTGNPNTLSEAGVYNSNVQMVEEIIVRTINNLMFDAKEDIGIQLDESTVQLIKDQFSKFFKLDGQIDFDAPISSIKMEAFKDSTRRTITQLRDRRLSDELIENTKVECK